MLNHKCSDKPKISKYTLMHHKTKISITSLPCINKITVSCSKQHAALNFAVVGRTLDYASNGRKTIRKKKKIYKSMT